jgi:hypothetical protein
MHTHACSLGYVKDSQTMTLVRKALCVVTVGYSQFVPTALPWAIYRCTAPPACGICGSSFLRTPWHCCVVAADRICDCNHVCVVTVPVTPCRFEELEYADAASYMENGEVVFTGSPAQMVARLRSMGARVR